MRQVFLTAGIVVLALQPAWAKNLAIRPTTTLRAQTANNTSAANSFRTQSNGNAGAGNVSKIDIRALLYPGSRTKIYAHLMPWFGSSSHMNVGYTSTGSNQVKRQVEDMISRGIDGVFIDWYGVGTPSDQVARLVMKQAEAHPGFSFAITVDTGAIKWHSCDGCSPQQALIKHLRYAEGAYFASSSYLRWSGAPVISNFDIDLLYKIDWQAVKNALTSSPVFIFQHSNGFAHALSAGSYSWVMPTTNDYGVDYLKAFYRTGEAHPSLQTIGATYKGFNDTLAGWSANRVMSQQCGQTWLRTFSTINNLYSSGKQLDAVQLVTWNDYEEGSEIESGIDNCVSISAGVSGDELKWKITGKENTIDHYTIFISKDGQNLMPLTDMATGNRSLNMCSFSLGAGSYQVFVKAAGKPSLRNQISGPAGYSPKCGGQAAQQITLQAKPNVLTMTLGAAASAGISVKSGAGPLDIPVQLACAGLPVGMECSFSPAVVSVKSGTATASLSVSTGAVSASLDQRGTAQGALSMGLLVFGVVGLAGIGDVKRKTLFRSLMVAAVASMVVFLTACGGGATPVVKAGSVYSISVVGTTGDTQTSAAISVTVK